MIADRALGLSELLQRIDALDNVISGGAQNDLYVSVQQMLRGVVRDLVRDPRGLDDVEASANRLATAVTEMTTGWRDVMSATDKLAADTLTAGMTAMRVPLDLAEAIARLPLFADLIAVDRIATETRASVADTARAYLALGAELHLTAIKAKAHALQPADDYDAMATRDAVQQVNIAHARFTHVLISSGHSTLDFSAVKPFLAQLASGDGMTVSRLVVAASRLRDVAVP